MAYKTFRTSYFDAVAFRSRMTSNKPTNTTAEITLRNGATIDNGSASVLTITETTIALVGAVTMSSTLGLTGVLSLGTLGATLTGASTSGTTLTKLLVTPSASAATTSISYHKLLAIGDVTGNTAFGMGDPTKPTTGLMACFGRTALATGTMTDTGADFRIINKLVDTTGVHSMQAVYIKAKNYSGATLTGDLIGLFIECVADGTVSGSSYGLKIGSDGTTLTSDILLRNGATINNSAEAVLTITEGTIALVGDVTATSIAIGGGYGSTGVTISSAGVGQFNGALTTDAALTADSAVIGGGYASTGATISNAGVGQFAGALTTDSTLTSAGQITTGGVGAKNGATVTAVEKGNDVVHQTVLTFTDTPVALTDEAGVVAYGGVKVYDFPEGAIQMLGAVLDVDLTKSSAGVNDDWDGDVGVGTVTATNDAALATTEQNIIPTTATPQAAAGATTANAQSTLTEAGLVLDGTTTAADVFVNFLVDDADHDVTGAACNLIMNGTLTLTWIKLGDY